MVSIFARTGATLCMLALPFGAVSAQGQSGAPVSYVFITDKGKTKAILSGAESYRGGVIRVIFIDRRPVRLPEAQIVADIRAGHLIPVYPGTRERLSREDWVNSLPGWLGYETRSAAGSSVPAIPER